METFLTYVVPALVAVAGTVSIVIAHRAATGVLGRNDFVGLRTQATLASDEAWVAGHRAGYSLAVLSGLALALSGVAALVWPATVTWAIFLCGGAVVSMVLLIAANSRAAKAARAVTPDGRTAP
ncbi:SdpI family protein [Demequina sp. B12]|uniref:SdpI family protein n=1 Tax=Demequina sp. B12 TaxID=2992757 RepID=UPI00237BAC1B|nr:SdpI family protein [Demequina sp. B12]MDE0573377.1 SdpI family protein [Demequina sp. B12]